jgi:hypothetical protein
MCKDKEPQWYVVPTKRNIQYLDSGFLDELETAVRSAGDEPGVKVASGQTTLVHSAQPVHILPNSGKELRYYQ